MKFNDHILVTCVRSDLRKKNSHWCVLVYFLKLLFCFRAPTTKIFLNKFKSSEMIAIAMLDSSKIKFSSEIMEMTVKIFTTASIIYKVLIYLFRTF